MPQTAEIASQPTHDTHTKAYHVRRELSSYPLDAYRGQLTDDGEFVGMFLEVRGVTRVQMAAYLLIITKAPLYDWDEVEPHIIRILQEWTRTQNALDKLDEVEEVA